MGALPFNPSRTRPPSAGSGSDESTPPQVDLLDHNPSVTLREVIGRLEEFAADETIYAASTMPTARAVVAAEPEDGSVPPVAEGLTYLLEVAAARDTIEVWASWRDGREPTLDDKLEAVTYYAQNDAWLPID